jgi:hypothetical protein
LVTDPQVIAAHPEHIAPIALRLVSGVQRIGLIGGR